MGDASASRILSLATTNPRNPSVCPNSFYDFPTSPLDVILPFSHL